MVSLLYSSKWDKVKRAEKGEAILLFVFDAGGDASLVEEDFQNFSDLRLRLVSDNRAVRFARDGVAAFQHFHRRQGVQLTASRLEPPALSAKLRSYQLVQMLAQANYLVFFSFYLHGRF